MPSVLLSWIVFGLGASFLAVNWALDIEWLTQTPFLSAAKETHEVEEYSFSQSTLEQVFLNFAKKQLEEGEDVDNAKVKAGLERQLSKSVNSPLTVESLQSNCLEERL